MSGNTKIEWTDETWNPVVGCSEDALMAPLRWRKPRRVFVNSMGDLFHEDVPNEWIDDVFAVMALTPQHTYQVLTKRAERMRRYCSARRPETHGFAGRISRKGPYIEVRDWPLPNVWLGVSCEDQTRADERIPHLLDTPAAMRFASLEPLLGAVKLPTSRCPVCAYTNQDVAEQMDHHLCSGPGPSPALDWVICGGESGPNARPVHPNWARSIRDQCQAASVPFFFKQWGEWFPRDQWEHNPSLILPDDDVAYIHNPEAGTHVFINDLREHFPLHRVGKKAAGRLLDGREWNGMPEGSIEEARRARA